MEKTVKYVTYTISGAILASSLYFYRTVELGRGDAQSVVLEILNPAGEMVGPEGILFDAAGNLYVGDTRGIVWELKQGGSPRIYAELARVSIQPGTPPATGAIQVGGMAFDARGNLYAACFEYGGGSVLRIDAGTKEIRFFARGIGFADYLVISQDGKYLWVSDYRSQGRILRYPIGDALPVQPDLIVTGLEHPNGLAFGKAEAVLYAAERYSGNIARIDLAGGQPRLERVVNLKGSFATGSLDGLAFDPRDFERRFLYVAENVRGLITVVDLNLRPAAAIKSFRLALMGGRPCPASMTIRDGYLYFTDLWSCSPFRILLGVPKWHNHAYRFRVLDLSALSTSWEKRGQAPNFR